MSDNDWEETVRKVVGMWAGKEGMEEGPVGIMVANAVTSYMAAAIVLGDDTLDQKFECFLVGAGAGADAENNERCARTGRARPNMKTIAYTVVAMMTEPNTIERADEMWVESVRTRFNNAENAAWAMLAADTNQNIMMLLVPNEVVAWWMEGEKGRTPDGCPPGILRALREMGVNNGYHAVVPKNLARIIMNIKGR